MLADALKAAPSTGSRFSIPFAKACCRSSRITNAYTSFKLGSGSSERILDQTVP